MDSPLKIEAEPDLPSQELLRRAKEAGYAGGKSAFYDLAARAVTIAGDPARMRDADGNSLRGRTLLHDLASGRVELLLGASPLLTDRLGLAGGTFDAPRLEVAT